MVGVVGFGDGAGVVDSGALVTSSGWEVAGASEAGAEEGFGTIHSSVTVTVFGSETVMVFGPQAWFSQVVTVKVVGIGQ